MGCGTGKENDPSRLSKDEYLKTVTEKVLKLQETTTKLSNAVTNEKELKNVINTVKKDIDAIIDIKGPEELDKEEKAIDDAFEQFKDIIASAQKLVKDPSGYSKYIADINAVAAKLNQAEQAYRAK